MSFERLWRWVWSSPSITIPYLSYQIWYPSCLRHSYECRVTMVTCLVFHSCEGYLEGVSGRYESPFHRMIWECRIFGHSQLRTISAIGPHNRFFHLCQLSSSTGSCTRAEEKTLSTLTPFRSVWTRKWRILILIIVEQLLSCPVCWFIVTSIFNQFSVQYSRIWVMTSF